MAEKTITEQIVREAPEIEALKLGLINSAKDLSDIQIQLPGQEIAGLTGLQQQAATLGGAAGGIGGYQPFLTSGSQTIGTGRYIRHGPRNIGSVSDTDYRRATGHLRVRSTVRTDGPFCLHQPVPAAGR